MQNPGKPAQRPAPAPLNNAEQGLTMCSATMLAIEDGQRRVWLLLEKPEELAEPTGLWHFPLGALAPQEQPLAGAKRALTALVQVTERGRPIPLSRARYRVSGASPMADEAILPPLAVQSGSNILFAHYATLAVQSLKDTTAFDLRHPGRGVALATSQEVQGLIELKKLCPDSQRHWAALRTVLGFQL